MRRCKGRGRLRSFLNHDDLRRVIPLPEPHDVLAEADRWEAAGQWGMAGALRAMHERFGPLDGPGREGAR